MPGNDTRGRMTNHRYFQLAELNDRATYERAAHYCRSIKATTINNHGAASYFTLKAQQWERIRAASSRLLSRGA